jgi:DNA-binding HxlR family transcriptional regulator
MRSYGQYCPVARTSELLAERWTPILVRNLLAGCRTFGELLEGAPGISKALLTQRLQLLERHGIVVKEPGSGRTPWLYALTEKGRALKAVTDAMGEWGAAWLELEPGELDPAYTLWATAKLVEPSLIPGGRLVVGVQLTDRPKDRWWLLLREPYSEVCSTYLGWDEDLHLVTDTETLSRWNLRQIELADARRAGRLQLDGPRAKVRSFLGALRPSPYARTSPRYETTYGS